MRTFKLVLSYILVGCIPPLFFGFLTTFSKYGFYQGFLLGTVLDGCAIILIGLTILIMWLQEEF